MLIRNVITRTTLLVLSAGILSLAALAQANPGTPPATSANAKPKVRAITGFVRLERAQYQQQLLAALKALRQAESEFVAAGYEVETVRITTQPLAELVSGLSDADALSFLKELDQFSVKEKFLPNVGPGMLHDSDSPATMHLLAQALSQLPNIEGSSIIASADGIHWNVIRETAALVKYVAEHSPHSQGNFNFTATAMLQPYSPFFPGSYHTGSGQQFAIGFEGANLVQQVFARTHGNAAQATSELTRALTEHSQVAE